MDIRKVRKYIFELAGSNMYVIAENNSALVIDPCISEEALKYLRDNNVKDITVLLTHEHYDHISGLTWLQSNFNCVIICHKETALSLNKGSNNRPAVIATMMIKDYSRDYIKKAVKGLPAGFKISADITFVEKYLYIWNNHKIEFVSTPGHSKGSCCIEIDDNIVITGDSLIPDFESITGFPGGSKLEYKTITLKYLKSISNNKWILPGHGEIIKKSEIEL